MAPISLLSFIHHLRGSRHATPVILVGVFVTAAVAIPSSAAGQFVQDDTATTNRGTAVTIDVLANDSGSWIGDEYTQPAHGTASSSGGKMIYTPVPEFAGVDTFTYTLTDVSLVQLTATVTITVLPGPLAINDYAATNVGKAVTIPVLANDFGTITSKTFTQPLHGTVVESVSALKYTPAAGFIGVDTFQYTASDAAAVTSTAMVTVAVNRVVFVDVTAAAGIDYIQCREPVCIKGDSILAMSGGAAAGDYDGDGDVDLFVTRLDAPGILYRNNGNGTFTDVTAGSGIDLAAGSNGAAWGDVDNDGRLDLYVTSLLSKRFHLYMNRGGGVFGEEAIARGASLQGSDPHNGYSVTFGDYDKDGYLDIHTTEWRPDEMKPAGALSNSRLLHNRGSAAPGYFEDVTQAAGVALDNIVGVAAGTWSFASRFADMDNDGLLDLVVVADGRESRLFFNNGNGTFTDGTVAAGIGGDENGMGNAIADVNGDGRLDWFISSIWDPVGVCADASCFVGTTGNRLYINNGNRTFTDATDAAGVRDGGWGWGSTFIDYDNDGDQDLVHTNGIRQGPPSWPWRTDQMRFFENDGSTVFTEKATAVGLFDTREGKGLLKFDYDGDGDLDIFVVNAAGRPVLYRNDGGNANGWLRVKFATSAQYIGARIVVKVDANGPAQTWEVNAGSNFLGQDETTAHFGLGRHRGAVSSVTVTLPSGVVKVYTKVPRNSVLTVKD